MRKEVEEKMIVYKSMVKRANEFKSLHYCPQMNELVS